jgi:phospholipase C
MAVKAVYRLVCIASLAMLLSSCSSIPKAPGSGGGGGSGSGGSGSSGDVTKLNHIIYIAQENRSFDSYFGALRDYWAKNGYPDQSFDGLPQFNPASGASPLNGPAPSLPGCDPSAPLPSDCVFDPNNPVTSFHFETECVENPSPSWDEAHVDWDYNDPVGNSAATLNGFVHTAAHDARTVSPPFNDTDGVRAMGYYDGDDLNYYYFMASNFATSDRWFQPVMTRTQPNREFLLAGTSQGHVYPLASGYLSAKTIFEELQDAGISWKIYVNTDGTRCQNDVNDAKCLINLTYLANFAFGQSIPSKYPKNIGNMTDYFNDVKNGTLPQVAQIEPATSAHLDEHPADTDTQRNSVQNGAAYISTLINALMKSSSWKDSAFILTFDENGGFYDHVSPQPAVSPDGIKPVDLRSGDVCTTTGGPICDFTTTGYRVPLVVISPYAKKNYVSHTVADLTAILKLIETRFKLPALTNRDAAQMDMTEFFDFNKPAWMTPPSAPAQNTGGACYLDHLP